MILALAEHCVSTRRRPLSAAASASISRKRRGGGERSRTAVSSTPPGASRRMRPEVDLLVAAQRLGQGGPGLGESRRIEHDGVEPAAFALEAPEQIEGVGLDPLEIAESVAAPHSPAPRASASALASRAVTRAGAGGEVQGEAAMVGEAVERGAARRGQRGGEHPVGALVEEGAGLLSGPGCGEVAHARLRGSRSASGTVPRTSSTSSGSPSGRRTPTSLRSRIPSGPSSVVEGVEDVGPHGLEAGGEQLHHQPAVVAVHHERGEPVALAVHQRGRRWHRCRSRAATQCGAAARATSRHRATTSCGSSSRSRISELGEQSAMPEKLARGGLHAAEPRGIGCARRRRSGRSRGGPAPAIGAFWADSCGGEGIDWGEWVKGEKVQGSGKDRSYPFTPFTLHFSPARSGLNTVAPRRYTCRISSRVRWV